MNAQGEGSPRAALYMRPPRHPLQAATITPSRGDTGRLGRMPAARALQPPVPRVRPAPWALAPPSATLPAPPIRRCGNAEGGAGGHQGGLPPRPRRSRSSATHRLGAGHQG